MAPHMTPDHLVVSIAAGITINTLEEGLGHGTRVVRVMPNTPALVQSGASAYGALKAAAKLWLMWWLSCLFLLHAALLAPPPASIPLQLPALPCRAPPATSPASLMRPNTPLIFPPAALGTHATPHDAELVDLLLGSVGFCIRVEEKQLDAVTGEGRVACIWCSHLLAFVCQA